VLLQLISKVLGGGQSQSGCDDTFNPAVRCDLQICLRWIRSQIDKESTVGDTATFLKVLLEETSSLHVDTHGGEHDGEVVLVAIMNTLGSPRPSDETGLTTDLGSNFVVGKTRSTEDGNLLPTSDRVLL
jgi:hypothetical protein